jgi:hypothetical protein
MESIMKTHILWKDAEENKLEKEVLSEYSRDEVWKHIQYLTTLVRRAGTEEELRAATYIKERLDEYKVDNRLYEIDAYISHPGDAELEVLSPIRQSIPCSPRTFIVSTPSGGLEAEVISVGNGLEEAYTGIDARGKIVLVRPGDVEGRIESARVAQEMGALGQIHITSGRSKVISMGQLRNTWGGPTLETMNKLPRIPAISISSEDGEKLIDLCRKGRVGVKMKAEAWRGYKKIRIPVGTLNGTREPEKFVLMAGHYCSWYVGATDNAVANSLMLEMARIFSRKRKRLHRGIRFAWWSGHEQGTYAGSTWYLDNFWDDIRDHAVAYLVLDGLGRIDSSGFEPKNTEEIRKFQESIIKEKLKIDVKSKRVPRVGDQSYWGMGLPSATGRTGYTPEYTAAMDGEPIWYSHTAEDTLDKVDMDVAEIPFKVYSVSALRLCNSPILPFEFVTMAEGFMKRLKELQDKGGSILDLNPVIHEAHELKKGVENLDRKIRSLTGFLKRGESKTVGNECKIVNRCLMELSRILMPALSSKAGKYGQDPMGSKFKLIPVLQPLEGMSSMNSGSEEYKALRTSLLRERNSLSDSLHSANRLLEDTLRDVSAKRKKI